MSTFRRRMMMKAKEQQSSVGEWDYFTIVAGENPVNMEIAPYMFYNESDGTDGYVETSYSIDGGEWVDFSDWLPLTIPPQSRVRFCSNVQNYEMIETACQFVSVDNFSIDGTVMSLMYGHEFNGEYEIPANIISGVLVFFDQESPGHNSSGLTRISNIETLLPATILTSRCYQTMFRHCVLLSEAPKLPATTLAENCYKEMFQGCTSLVNAPELPATTLFDYCYESMFTDCTNLNYIKMLATNISALNCLNNWVYRVALTGTFVKSKDATWNVVGVNGVPTGWTVITDEEESGGGKITNNIILSYAGSGSFLRKLAVEMDYPAASDLIIQRSSDEGITWADLPPILAGTSNFTSPVYHIAGHIYRLKTAEDDTYVYTFTVEER